MEKKDLPSEDGKVYCLWSERKGKGEKAEKKWSMEMGYILLVTIS